jgi:membrane peptidoglycan carboxypeptidase
MLYFVWKQLGGYTAHRIYGSDDGHYALSCSQNNMIMAMIKEATCYHPYEDDQGYITWKRKAIANQLQEEELEGFNFNK